MAAPAAVLAVAALIHFHLPVAPLDTALLWTQPTPIVPQFTIAATIGIALPLFIITMAGQNITGIAVLRGLGYRPNAGALFGWSGAFGLLAAPFGAHAVQPRGDYRGNVRRRRRPRRRKRRYWAAVASGAAYVAFGLSAGAVVAFISRSPQLLIATVAALALLGALAAADAILLNRAHRTRSGVNHLHNHRHQFHRVRHRRRVLGPVNRRNDLLVG